MRRIRVVLLVGLLSVTNARIMASQMASLNPVAAMTVVDARAGTTASRNHEQRPIPMERKEMEHTKGNGFWSFVGAVLEAVAIGIVIGVVLGLCSYENVDCHGIGLE